MKLLAVFFAFAISLVFHAAYAAETTISKDQETVKTAITAVLVERGFTLDSESKSKIVLSKEVGGFRGALINALNGSNSDAPRNQLDFTVLPIRDGAKVIASRYLYTVLANGKIQRDKIDDGDLPDFLSELHNALETIEKKDSSKPVLGVQMASVNFKIAEMLNLGKPRGVILITVTPGTPADLSGLRQGDVILRYSTSSINTSEDLQAAVAATEPGSTVPIVVWRPPSGETSISLHYK